VLLDNVFSVISVTACKTVFSSALVGFISQKVVDAIRGLFAESIGFLAFGLTTDIGIILGIALFVTPAISVLNQNWFVTILYI